MGAFAQLFYEIGDMDIYEGLWNKEFKKTEAFLKEQKVLVHGMFDFIYYRYKTKLFQVDMYSTWRAIQDKDKEYVKTVPAITIIDEGISLHECLFVNPWDPHSMPGNGHFGDDSMDGCFGRSTSICLYSLRNEFLQSFPAFEKVKVPDYEFIKV